MCFWFSQPPGSQSPPVTFQNLAEDARILGSAPRCTSSGKMAFFYVVGIVDQMKRLLVVGCLGSFVDDLIPLAEVGEK